MDFQDILMGFLDFVPVIAFLIAAIYLQRSLYNKMSKGAFALFAAGTIVVVCAGAMKALAKILLTLRICNFGPLSQCFFPMQTIGFCLAGAGIAAIIFHPQGKGAALCFALPSALIVLGYNKDYSDVKYFSGTMVFVVLMCLGVLVLDGGLFIFAIKLKKPLIAILLVISFIFTLGMGYLSSKDSMNDLIKEVVNSIGQGSLLAAAILFKKHGLDDENFNVSIINK